MIKIILGKPWEGKSLEVVREIENSKDVRSVGVFSENCDFHYILSEFGDREILKSKDIFIYNPRATIKDVLNDGRKFDMIVLDLSRDWEDLSDEVRSLNCKNVVITQQLPFDW